MHYGLAIDDGWYKLYYDLCTDIERIIETRKLDPDKYCFSQVKEKFGFLRVYMTASTDEISEVIAQAQALSEKTCERCGDVGNLCDWGWLGVRCVECRRVEAVEREARWVRSQELRGRRDSGYGTTAN